MIKLPIHLNSRTILSKIFPFLPSRKDFRVLVDPDSSEKQQVEALREVYINGTFKTTTEDRHKDADSILLKHLNEDETIIDIGASDGITSLDLIKKLKHFTKFYITDYNLFLLFKKKWNGTYFYDDNTKDCISYCNSFFIISPQVNSWVKKIFSSAEGLESKIQLIHPTVKEYVAKNQDVKVMHFNIFEPIDAPTPSVVKVANVLNPVYFSDDEITLAIQNIYKLLELGGIFYVLDNRNHNKIIQASYFRKTSTGFDLFDKLNEGSDIEDQINKYSNLN